ncbi:Imm6 family immunity protein [Metabacillus sp. RGM 3146]|uniref:Imm6 family immunity protein n=1 Tax=Metabacillus sp. RGM 3146 TaxID=3401092 RepID=UPI003B9CE1F9
MNIDLIYDLEDNIKVAFALAIAEKAFDVIEKDDERYLDGRKALDTCWAWVESYSVSGDEIYELIDNAEFEGISEFAEDEEDLNIARMWSLLVDTVAYTAWQAYKKEKTKYLPQALEGIKEDSLDVYYQSALETSFITNEQIQNMKRQLMKNQQYFNGVTITKEDFLIKFKVCEAN